MLDKDDKAPQELGSYESYTLDPSPQNLRAVVGELSPTINYTLVSMGTRGDPVMENQAKLFAAKAVKKYDSSRGASLKTFVSNELKQMHRFARNANQPIRIPERDQWDHHAIYRAEQEFVESKGREPSTLELSEWTTIPVKRIEKIRKLPFALSEGQAAGGDPNNPNDIGEDSPDYFGEAMDYVYRSLTPRDQKIFEHMTGHLGAKELTPGEISERLGISQSQISRRFAAMMSDLQDIDNRLQEVS